MHYFCQIIYECPKIVEEATRDHTIDIINNEELVKEEPVKEEPTNVEQPIEEVKQEIKPKAKPRASRAKPKIKTAKESIEPVEPIVAVEEKPVEPIVVVEEKPAPVKVDKLKKIVQCPDRGLSMTQHTLLYIHKRRGFCKAVKEEPEKQVPEPVSVSVPKPKITL